MTLKKSFITLGAVLVLGLSIYAFYGSQIAKAAILSFSPSTCYTNAATTSPNYMSAGLGTTTLSCFTGFDGAVSASLELYLSASSTASVLVGQVEYSENNIDWYANNQDMYAAGAVAIATPSNSFTWTYASTTQGGAGALGTENTGTKIVKISTPTKYVRVILTNTGTPEAIWAKIIPRQATN